jgi:hypothetical protein
MKPTNPTRHSTIPCYAADGTSLGYRTITAAQRLVAGGHVRPAYGRKGHLRAIWLVRDDGTSPVQARAHNGTRYSYIESLATGRCWRLRRLDRRDATTADGSLVTARDPFLQVVRDCLTHSPDALAAGALPGRPAADRLVGHRTGDSLVGVAARSRATTVTRRNREVTLTQPGVTDALQCNLQ